MAWSLLASHQWNVEFFVKTQWEDLEQVLLVLTSIDCWLKIETSSYESVVIIRCFMEDI